MPSNPLTAFEREEIACGLAAGDYIKSIAENLGRCRTTISREVNRNGGRENYRCIAAEHRAGRQRRRPKIPKLVADRALAAHVTRRLKAKDSPYRISIEAANGVGGVRASISAETIYQATYRSGRGLQPGLGQHLHLKRRCRKHRARRVPGSHSLGIFCRIADRPQAADERCEVGHLEGDLIVGAMNRSALITVFDRMSRRLWLSGVASKSADDTYIALCALLRRIPEAFRLTLTWDQGSEIACHRELALSTKIQVYIADAKSPWQRPTNENGNALVRRYVGKGTNLNTYTTPKLRHIEYRVNTIPRRIHNNATALDIYTAATR